MFRFVIESFGFGIRQLSGGGFRDVQDLSSKWRFRGLGFLQSRGFRAVRAYEGGSWSCILPSDKCKAETTPERVRRLRKGGHHCNDLESRSAKLLSGFLLPFSGIGSQSGVLLSGSYRGLQTGCVALQRVTKILHTAMSVPTIADPKKLSLKWDKPVNRTPECRRKALLKISKEKRLVR